MARILLIDDDDDVRAMLRDTLTYFGHTVIEARNGKEGLELFPNARADILITDLVMPETEGIEVLLEVRAKQPSLKIIAISGGGRQRAAETLKMAKLLGAAYALTKPFSNEELMAAVDNLLSSGAKSGN